MYGLVKQFRVLWLNTKDVKAKRRIRHDWFMLEESAGTLEYYWEMVVNGKQS